ncbi:MAG: hypothetical protein UT00_C0023G0007 [Parcubacteria group bacterium GW2011_GWA1_38_7]|nr:MAG: hypothetical protein UT00_C0023G0007 [Parcubacteria group bacterium GW2011_GWA1_38_7]
MAKKRTRKQKQAAEVRHVNSQFQIKFEPGSAVLPKVKKSIDTAQTPETASIKKELLRSLTIASLILISLVVLYWFS